MASGNRIPGLAHTERRRLRCKPTLPADWPADSSGSTVTTGLGVDFTFDFGGDPQDVTITASGIADVAGLLHINAELRSDPRFRANMLILYDLSELDMARLSEVDMEQISAPIAVRDWDVPHRAMAVVAPNPQGLDRVRLAIAHLGGKRSRRRVFASRDDAIAWLREQRP